MSFLLDTDVCSAHPKGDRAVFSKFMQYAGRLHVSAVTAGELYSRVLRSKAPPARLQLLREYLAGVTLLPIDHEVAYRFGDLRARLLDQGQSPATADLLIAATCLVHGLTLVTHNVRHFATISGLRVENWLVA